MNKIYCIADIHGELDKLNNLLDNLKLDSSDILIFLGDYVDRGLNSYGVIERLLELHKTNMCVFLCGNHDFLFFDDTKFRSEEPPPSRYSLWNQGARETYNSYINAGVSPEIHFDFYKLLQPYYVLNINDEKHLFVHGGYNRHVLIEEQKNNDIFWWDRDLLSSAV